MASVDLDGLLDGKQAAIATYRTQAPALRRILPARALRYELTWAMP